MKRPKTWTAFFLIAGAYSLLPFVSLIGLDNYWAQKIYLEISPWYYGMYLIGAISAF